MRILPIPMAAYVYAKLRIDYLLLSMIIEILTWLGEIVMHWDYSTAVRKTNILEEAL